MRQYLSLWKGLVRAYSPRIRVTRRVADEILDEVCSEYAVRRQELLGVSRTAGIVEARHDAMWRFRQCRNEYGDPLYGYPELGRIFNRDHTTIIHGVRAHQRRMDAQQPHVTWAAE